ncbi:MAG: PaaI family thioesterase [Dehalococcoidia bacterium]
MSDEEHFRRLERMFASAPINEYFRPTMRVSEGRAVITVEVRRDFFHAANAVHAAFYFKALDDAAFFAVSSLVPDVFMLTASLNANLLRPVSGGEITAVGEVVHRSRRLFVAESKLSDSAGKELARASATFMRSDIPLSAEIGYV